MPQTTQCPHCGVVLNLPEGAAGRRLRCPKCGSRFEVPAAPGAAKPPSSATPPTTRTSGRPASSLILTESTELPMPRADMDLRERFSPDLLDAGETVAPPKKPASTPANDAEALLLEDSTPATPPRRGVAEARSQARRCPSCGRAVPAGMSLCRCGLDLDTGVRDAPAPEDLYDDDMPVARRHAGPPLDIAILGGLILVCGVVLTVVGLAFSVGPQEDLTRYATLALAALGGFTVYAGSRFVRGKSHRSGVFALVLIAVANIGGLIVWPIIEANRTPPGATIVEHRPVGLSDESLPAFENTAANLNTERLTAGVILLIFASGLIVYSLRPRVAHYFTHVRNQGEIRLG